MTDALDILRFQITISEMAEHIEALEARVKQLEELLFEKDELEDAE